ncbi:hypothetical protein DW073_08865 [Ruminococcus sp. AF45-4BH]|nr:hypothetical protein DW073_08865 [Ruminococcus sp. AF45-4BH]
MRFQMAAEGTSFADITRELNRQAIAACDEQKLSRGDSDGPFRCTDHNECLQSHCGKPNVVHP